MGLLSLKWHRIHAMSAAMEHTLLGVDPFSVRRVFQGNLQALRVQEKPNVPNARWDLVKISTVKRNATSVNLGCIHLV